MMDPEIRGRVDRLLQSYSAYYDVEECDERDLVAKARFHSRGEKYLLTRGVNLWSVEDHEYVFFFEGTSLDAEEDKYGGEHLRTIKMLVDYYKPAGHSVYRITTYDYE